MKYEIINIDIDYKKLGYNSADFNAEMCIYLPDNSEAIDPYKKRPTVIICPGGGYAYTSDREAEPVALKFLSEDCNAIVLRYSTPAKFPIALLELSYAVATARKNANEWNVDTEKIVVCGFSAGGHLAALFSSLWNKNFVKSFFEYENEENKPCGMILGYPVITSGSYAHKGSFINLIGEDADSELTELVSVEKQICHDTPPAFIWHTFTDKSVNVKNALLLAEALADNNISTELHIFPEGPHGLSLANGSVKKDYNGEYSECQAWIEMSIRWIKEL